MRKTVLAILLLLPAIAIAAPPRPHLKLQSVWAREGAAGGLTPVTVVATLDAPAPVQYVLHLDVAGGSVAGDTARSPQPLVIPAGATAATGEIYVKGDDVAELDEIYYLTFEAASPQSPELETGSTLCILNDDIGLGNNLWLNVGESVSIPLDLGNYLSPDATFSVTSNDPAVVALTPSVTPGSKDAVLKIDAIQGGETLITARVERASVVASGTISVKVFQPSTLVARPEAVQLRVGQETTLRVTMTPAQSAAATITAQPEIPGIVALANPSAETPVAGDAVFTLRGLAVGKTKLIVYAPGQTTSTAVSVEVGPAAGGRRRAAKP